MKEAIHASTGCFACGVPESAGSTVEELARQLAAARERADFAWRNTRAIDSARQDEMRKRDAAEAENKRLRNHLERAADAARAACDGWNDALMHEGARMAADAVLSLLESKDE